MIVDGDYTASIEGKGVGAVTLLTSAKNAAYNCSASGGNTNIEFDTYATKNRTSLLGYEI